jgi:hypothetical protein
MLTMKVWHGVRLGDLAADQRKDHEMYTDVSSPTAATSAVLAVAAIAAHQGREVMTIDVGGAFLHADIKLGDHDPAVHVELDEIMTRFLLELDPS